MECWWKAEWSSLNNCYYRKSCTNWWFIVTLWQGFSYMGCLTEVRHYWSAINSTRTTDYGQEKSKFLFKKEIYKWKMGPSNISFFSFRVIFHFHDYGRKGASSTLHFHHSSEFRGVETRWWFLTEVKSWKELRSELLAFLDGWQVRGHFIG